MANYYVLDGGSGSGTTWTDAADTLPATLTRGDTYYIGDGSYPTYTFDDAVSGTTVITIKKAIEGDHGTETGWSSAYGDGVAEWAHWRLETSYYTFNGQSGGGPGGWETGHGFKVVDTSGYRVRAIDNVTNIIIQRTEITETNNTPDSGVSFGALVYPGTDCTNWTFQYCYLHYVYGPCLQTAFVGSDNWLVEYCKLGDNTGDTSHSEVIVWQGTDDWTLRYNYFFDWRSTGCINCVVGTSGGTGDNNVNENIHIYGNIFDQGVGQASAIIAAVDDAGNTQFFRGARVYNNSFINLDSSASLVFFQASVTGVEDNLFSNNLFWGQTDGIDMRGTWNTTSYNKYPAGITVFNLAGTGDGTISADPWVSIASENFHLSGNTAAGVTLASPFDTDMDGVARATSGTWSIGAFEFVDNVSSSVVRTHSASSALLIA
ncbi:MAG: hypothetical protein ACKVK0_12865 [Pirellulales bacterium]